VEKTQFLLGVLLQFSWSNLDHSEKKPSSSGFFQTSGLKHSDSPDWIRRETS